MKTFLGYTRDSAGKVVNHHIQPLSNTIHTSSGSGGNTDTFILQVRRI